MARTRWLDRVRHRPVPTEPEAPTSHTSELLSAFLADPGSTDLRPITKAMSRDVAGWILGHPAVRTAEDAWALRAALIASPELQRLMELRLDCQRRMLVEALAEEDEVPPLFVVARLDALLTGEHDEFLRLLPHDSVLQVDVRAAGHRIELCREIFARVRKFGIRPALTGIQADGSEDEVVRLLAPDVLMLDVAAPMDYRDRLEEVVRLREEVAPHRAAVVMGSVATVVDEWAGNVCGADYLAGPLYDNQDLSALTHGRKDSASTDDLSPYEQAASRYPAAVDSLAVALERVREIVSRVTACGDHADAYVTYHQIPQMPQEVSTLIAEMVSSGAAVTALAPRFDGLTIPGLTYSAVTAEEPLAQGWSFVALLPGEGHVVAAMGLDHRGHPLRRRQSYVVAEDRDLALRIANRISQRAAASKH
jgi:hypothetical protein